MKTNILVQYDGGGYDGCIWEWNFFYIDKTGGFHDIYSSGSGGIGSSFAAALLVENDGNNFSSRVFVYYLDNETELRDFAVETNCHLVKSVVKWFNDYNVPDVEPACDRSDCRYYLLYNLSYVREKCSECLENCQRKISDGYNHYECE